MNEWRSSVHPQLSCRTTDSAGRKWAGSRTSWAARSLSYARNRERFMAVNEQEFCAGSKAWAGTAEDRLCGARRYDPHASRIISDLASAAGSEDAALTAEQSLDPAYETLDTSRDA